MPDPVPSKGFFGQLFDISTTLGKVASVIGTLLIATIGFVAGDLRGQIFPDYTLSLLAPPLAANGESRVNAGCIVVTWEVQRNWILRSADVDKVGEVFVVPEGGDISLTVPGYRSGDRIHLPPGRYRLTVRDPHRAVGTAPVWVEAGNSNYNAEKATEECGPALSAPIAEPGRS